MKSGFNKAKVFLKSKKHKRAVFITALLCLYSAFTFYITGSVCFVSAVFGIPCPGCGMTRSWFAALRLDMYTAFAMHPLFLYPPLLAAAVFVKRLKFKNKNAKWFNIFCIASLILFASVYAVRMSLFFPRVAPMTVNGKSFLFRIIKLVQTILPV
jgi:hypothetical protein